MKDTRRAAIRAARLGPPSSMKRAGSATPYPIASPSSRSRMPSAIVSALILSPTFGLAAPYHSRYFKSALGGSPQVPSDSTYQPTQNGFEEPQSNALNRLAT